MDFTFIEGGVCASEGFTANGIHCGIRRNKDKPDLAMIYSDCECSVAAVFTQNLAYGAPIKVTREHISNGTARAVICNSGIANTCAKDGYEKAVAVSSLAAKALKIPESDIIVSSTGVIGPSLELEPFEKGIEPLVDGLSKFGSEKAALAIMTTDTVKKEVAAEFNLGGKTCHIGGITKGSGMIHPNMATMLCFMTTDVAISSDMLKKALEHAVADSFNMLSVDGDTSTNDTLCILANGKAGNEEIQSDSEDFKLFSDILMQLCITLARKMAKDGEGATKLVECYTHGAASKNDAKKIAKSVICSSLVKSAMFGADANWGRVICAVGYAGIPVDINKTDIAFESETGTVNVCKDGAAVDFSEEEAKKILSDDEIVIDVNLNQGDSEATAFGCDLTYDYVKINGDYRT